uniref:Major facilitator superfamily (MFS) profile domain-containing protein n=1 Tax=Tetranychus urticae TaxID=32264 RepID=T1KEE7_TETUR
MKPARRTSSEVNRLQRNINYLERQPLLRPISNNQPNNNSTFNSNSVNLSRSVEKGLPSDNKISSELIVPTIGRKGHLSESSDSCDNVTLPLNHSQKWILLCLCLVDFSAFASMSIIAPFFPYELYLRGQTTYVAGLVFSIYSLTVVISSVFFGPLSAHIGPKFMLLTGITVAGIANIIFGLLDYISNDTTFIALCFIVRIVEAVGAASFNTASLVYVFEIFPDHVSYVLQSVAYCTVGEAMVYPSTFLELLHSLRYLYVFQSYQELVKPDEI